MNFISRVISVSLLLTANGLFATEAFEGKVRLAITDGKNHSMEMDFTLKGQQQRTDMVAEGRQMSSIMDFTKGEMLMLMPDQGMYMVMPIKKPVEQAMTGQGAESAEIEKTGRTETILGHACDQYLVSDKSKGTSTEIWIASGLGTFMGLGGSNPMGGAGMFGGRKGGAGAKWEEMIKGKGGFPLRVVSHDSKGKEIFKMEATKIEPGPVPDSLFAPPENYRKFSIPDMGGMNPFGKG